MFEIMSPVVLHGMRTIACGSGQFSMAAATFVALLTAGRAGAQPAPSPGRSVLLVGNSVNGTVSVLDDDGRTYQNLGTINVIPDLRKRMISMNLLFWQRLAYGIVKGRQLITHGEPDHGNRFVDDLFLSPNGATLYVSRSNLGDVAAFDLTDRTTSARRPKMLWRRRLGAHADHATLSENGKQIVVSVSERSRVYVLDASDGHSLGSFSTGKLPHQNEYSFDGKRLYNGNLGDLDRKFADPKKNKEPFILTVVNSDDFKDVRRIAFPAALRPMVLSDDERTLFIQLSYVNGVQKYDIEHKPNAPLTPDGRETPVLLDRFDEPETDINPIYKSKDEFPHNSAHHGLAISRDGSTLCDCGTIDDTVSLVPTADMKRGKPIPVGKIPYWATTSADGAHCLVSLSGDDAIAVVDYSTAAVSLVRLATPAGDAVTERKNTKYFPQRTRLGKMPQAVIDKLFPPAATR